VNAQERIIRYWHAVELLQPSQLKKPEDSAGRSPKDEFVHDIQSSNEPFPWEPGSEASRQPLPLDEIDKRTGKPKVYTWFHTLYVQIFPTKTITDALDRAFGADQGYRDPAEREYSALYAAEFTHDGQLVPGSFTLSSEAWFLGRLTSGSDWSKDFNQDQTSIRQQAEARLTGSVNRQALDELTTFVIQQCGLQTVLSNPEKAVLRSCSRPVEVKGQQHDTISDTAVGNIPAQAAPTSGASAHVVAGTPKGGFTETEESITRPQPRQSDLPLNSFLLDDLIRVAEAVATGNTSKALSQYLDPNTSITRHTIGSAELESAIVDHLPPPTPPPAGSRDGAALVQHDGTAAVVERLTHGMGNHHGGQFVVGDDLFRQFHHEGRGFGVEGGGVFVQQQDFAGLQASHQQADGLALTTRQQTDAVAQAILQSQAQHGQPLAEQLTGLTIDGATQPARFSARQSQRHVLLDGERLAGARHRVLEDPGHALGPVPGGQPRDILVVDPDGAAVDAQVAGNGVEEGGFPGPVGADHRDELPFGDGQGHAPQHRVLDGGTGVEGNVQVLGV